MMLSNDFEKIAKRRKNRSIIRNVTISFVICILALSLVYVGLNAIYQKYEKKEKKSPLKGMENSYSVFKENAQKYLTLEHKF